MSQSPSVIEVDMVVLVHEFTDYIELVKGYTPVTAVNYKQQLIAFFAWSSIVTLTELTPELVDNYRDYRLERGLSPNTHFNFVIALRAFLKFLNKRKNYNFRLEQFEVPRRKKVHMEYITPDELQKMVDATTRERDRLMLLIAYTSGCRVNELMQISVENLNGNKFRCVVKGGKDHVYHFDPMVANRLYSYMAIEHITTGRVWRDTTSRPVKSNTFTYVVKKAGQRASIPHKVNPHQLRHGFGTAMIENGADIRTVQEMMGHENIQTTQRYLHITGKRMEESHNRYAPKVAESYFSTGHTNLAVDKTNSSW